jgi:hypothetical protein
MPEVDGIWNLCRMSGGADGDYQITHHILNKNYNYTMIYYGSHDGSCTNPLFNIFAAHTLTLGTDVPLYWTEAYPVNVKFSGPRTLTLLSSSTEAVDRARYCTGEANPTIGGTYELTDPVCLSGSVYEGLPVAGQVVYTIFNIDRTTVPYKFQTAGAGTPDDGSTVEKRFQYIESLDYFKL